MKQMITGKISKSLAGGVALVALAFAVSATGAAAQTMEAALARAYSANPRLMPSALRCG